MCHSCNHHRQSDHKQHKRTTRKMKMIEEIRKDAEARRGRAYDKKYGKTNNYITIKEDKINKYFVIAQPIKC